MINETGVISISPPVMTDDASTAYICIYCPFNSDNLEALESHLTNAHGHGCQDAPSPSLAQVQSSPSSNIINKAGKREAPDDEQSQSSLNGINQTKEHPVGVKRVKRTLSPTVSTSIFINGNDVHSEQSDDDDDDDDEEDDERDSSANPTTMLPRTILTCPTCSSTYHRLGHLLRHAKRKHHIDLSNYDGPHTFDILTSQTNHSETLDMEINRNVQEQINPVKLEDMSSSGKSVHQQNEIKSETSPTATTAVTTDCPYCDYKTIDIEQFKSHIIAHIRDKNYRCLLCNRLYKYRGDCSFHIRRKHHRYSTNSNDYIQRFLFDTTDGDETMSTQSGGHGSSINGTINNPNGSREQDEPVRYFGCPYCDYTSNYGGDVRKHQARKHPNVESKVIKIIRQDSEHQIPLSTPNHNHNFTPNDDDDDDNAAGDNDTNQANSKIISKPNINLIEQQERKEKLKTVKKTDVNFIQPHPSTLPNLPNFAPVRVFQCSSCHQQGTYKWVVERHIRAKHPDQPHAHVIELPAELAVKLQKITPPLKRFRCSLCPLQSKHTWVIIRHIKHFHTLQTASVLDIQPDGTPINDESFTFQNGDFSSKSYHHDSESSSISSSCNETGPHDLSRQQDLEDEDDESDHIRSALNPNANDSMIFLYKCSQCDFTSNVPWNIQKHINDLHSDQPNAHMLTQCRPNITDLNQKSNNKKSKHKNGNHTTIATVTKMSLAAPLSPTSALAKAKFSPAVEEALLSLQGSKLNTGLYAVQPKFGIKRLKCRHCFYRSNWKTDMIRHVRIRHCLTEPDHNKDMIMMTEQEARSTIETYENTFGKELRRRTFRTWNDWAKAEEEFTPKDGSLQYINTNGEQPTMMDTSKLKKTTHIPLSTNDDLKRSSKMKVKNETKIITQNYNQVKQEFKQLPNPSNIVSRLLLTTSPSHSNDDDAPLDLSCKSSSPSFSSDIKLNHQLLLPTDEMRYNGDNQNQIKLEKYDHLDDDAEEEEEEEENTNGNSTVNYICSVCPYKRSNFSLVHRHLLLHLTGQGVVCPLCSYTTLSSNSMMRHMIIIHPTSTTITKFQPVTRTSTATVVEQHQCSICSYQCDRSEALAVHRRLEHDDEEFDIDSSSGIGGGGDDDMDEEEEMHNDDISLPVDTNNNIFQCSLCTPSSNTTNFSNLEQFTMHVFTNHNNQMQNNQSCPFCSFIAHITSPYTLVEHIKLHFNGTLVQPDPIVGIENVKELLLE